jgi:hypothetical protein
MDSCSVRKMSVRVLPRGGDVSAPADITIGVIALIALADLLKVKGKK